MEQCPIDRISTCNQRFESLQELLEAKFAAQEKALGVANDEMNRRLKGMNEFREQLSRQAATFIDVSRYDSDRRSLYIERAQRGKEIELLREWKATNEGEKSKTTIISWIALIVSVVTSVLHILTMYSK